MPSVASVYYFSFITQLKSMASSYPTGHGKFYAARNLAQVKVFTDFLFISKHPLEFSMLVNVSNDTVTPEKLFDSIH